MRSIHGSVARMVKQQVTCQLPTNMAMSSKGIPGLENLIMEEKSRIAMVPQGKLGEILYVLYLR